MIEGPVCNISFYRFAALENLPPLRRQLKADCQRLGLLGTLILSPEGINGFLAGSETALQDFMDLLGLIPPLAGIVPKKSFSDFVPFQHLYVKLKKEIIPFAIPQIAPEKYTGPRLDSKTLKSWLDQNKDIILLDTRNQFEIEAGTFKGAIDLGLKTFREFPKALKNTPADWKERPVVMFCTGGIRCEKATALALQEGFKQVYQLEGGILKYFEECGSSHFRGNCFVFDERVGLDGDLKPVSRPIQK